MITLEEFSNALDIIVHSNAFSFIVTALIVLFLAFSVFRSFVSSVKGIIYRSEPPTKFKKGLDLDKTNNGGDFDS